MEFKPGQCVKYKEREFWLDVDGYLFYQQPSPPRRWTVFTEFREDGLNRYPKAKYDALELLRKRPTYEMLTDPQTAKQLIGTPSTGTDPEFFVAKNGIPVPAFQVLPHKTEVTTCAPFWDGFQAEVRMYASICHTEFMRRCLGPAIRSFAAKGLEILPTPAWRVPEDILQTAPDHFVELGCDPSLNAYGMHGRPVRNPRELKVRFAGGHMHFGSQYLAGKPDLAVQIAKSLDAFLAIPCVCLFQNYDKPIRRRYYGLAGEFRMPPHGMEYRTLSNGWTLHPQVSQLVLDLGRWAFHLGWLGWSKFLLQSQQRDVVEIINWHDVPAAKQFMAEHAQIFTDWAKHVYEGSGMFWRAIDKGIEAAVPGFGKNIHDSWKVGGVSSPFDDLVYAGLWRKVENPNSPNEGLL